MHGFLQSIVELDPPRPPAFRILALPVTLLFGPEPRILRPISFFYRATFLYLAANEIAGALAGGVSAIFFVTSISVVEATKTFGTEYGLYLATSLTLYFLFKNWNVPHDDRKNWIGLGLALGLGAWTKTSFLLIGGPIACLALILSWYKVVVGRSRLFLTKALALGTALALPWWALNYRAAIAFARFSRDWARVSLGSPSLATLGRWIGEFAQHGIGLPLSLLMIVLLVPLLVRNLNAPQTGMDLTRITAIWISMAGAFPLTIARLFGNNHLVRLISPSLIPLAVVLGVTAAVTEWMHTRRVLAMIGILFCLQVAVVISEVNRTADVDQWDSGKLRQISKQNQLFDPSIVYLGYHNGFNLPQIAYPWIRTDERVKVQWLWQHEDGDINWESVFKRVSYSNVVLTIQPSDSPGTQRIVWQDNAYNSEFIRRLETNTHFLKPLQLELGQDTVLFFLRQAKGTEPVNYKSDFQSRLMWQSWDKGESFCPDLCN